MCDLNNDHELFPVSNQLSLVQSPEVMAFPRYPMVASELQLIWGVTIYQILYFFFPSY